MDISKIVEVARQAVTLIIRVLKDFATFDKQDASQLIEAAKVIENTQRDLKIALINELAVIFNRMGIDTEAVLKVAESKWSFLPFWPWLFGGHCIGADSYRLTNKAEAIGYQPPPRSSWPR